MSLNLQIRPGDRFFIGDNTVTVNVDHIVTVTVAGNAPVLRASDYVSEAEATTSSLRFRRLIQQMFLTGDTASYHSAYFIQARAVCMDRPTAAALVAEINGLLMQGQTYRAIRLAKTLSDAESEAGCFGPRLVGWADS